MITSPCLCTREDVKRAIDIKTTARSDDAVDRAIEAATGLVHGQMHRSFLPWTGTKFFDWPGDQYAAPWILRLDQHELAEVTRLQAAGVTIPPSAFFLEPNGSGPPYTRIEIDLASSAAFEAGATTQRAIAVTGVYCGAPLTTAAAGALAADIDDATTAITVSDSAAFGVGDVLLADAERLLVADRRNTDTGASLTAPLAASAADTTVHLSSPAVEPGETILIGGERMLVIDTAGTALVVKRHWDGAALAAHDAGATVWAPRRLVVQRGALGTDPAAHFGGTALTRHVVPGLIRQLATAEAISQGMQEGAGWARQAGSGESEREVLQRGLGVLREQAYVAYGRKARTRAV